ncbi:MAG: hypothetical protein ABIJ96_12745 [Elusimicrobiota bacterium]
MTPQLHVVFYRPLPQAAGPVEKEYEAAVRQPKDRAKIDAMLDCLGEHGFSCPGIRHEMIKGVRERIHEPKIKAFGSEHRFLAGYAPRLAPDGRRILVLLKYLNKKRRRLRSGDIETAKDRLKQVRRERGGGDA